jgi:hypothetical protein
MKLHQPPGGLELSFVARAVCGLVTDRERPPSDHHALSAPDAAAVLQPDGSVFLFLSRCLWLLAGLRSQVSGHHVDPNETKLNPFPVIVFFANGYCAIRLYVGIGRFTTHTALRRNTYECMHAAIQCHDRRIHIVGRSLRLNDRRSRHG